MKAREVKRQKLVDKYAAKRETLKKEGDWQAIQLLPKILLRCDYITVGNIHPDVLAAICVSLVFHAYYLAKWLWIRASGRGSCRRETSCTGHGNVAEADEVQHFMSAPSLALDLYPEDIALGFDLGTYRGLITTWRSKADRAYAHKTSADFPSPTPRAQRAYNDSLRDLLAPTFTGRPVVRLAVRHLTDRWTGSSTA